MVKVPWVDDFVGDGEYGVAERKRMILADSIEGREQI